VPIARAASAKAQRVTLNPHAGVRALRPPGVQKGVTNSVSTIVVTTEPPVSPQTPTVTHYQQLAADFVKALDQIATIIPQLEEAELAVAKFTRGQLGIPEKFCATAIAAVEQLPELQALNRLDPVAGRDTLQFLEAFRTVRDRAVAFAKSLKFSFDSRKANLSRQSLQIYAVAKGLARDKRNPEVAAHVENMKRDLARPVPTKEQREQRKAIFATAKALVKNEAKAKKEVQSA
jgi:hypothetical protein